jgi:SAM-dependent methyltransferase
VELLLGAGSSRERRLTVAGRTGWSKLVTLDLVPEHRPDIVHDLDVCPWPLEADAFDEVHAYELVEHLGRQGDFRAFFEFFGEAWRVLKPGGFFAGTCPSWRSMWAWGDPGHTRVITSGTLAFLSQAEYRKQVGRTPMTDYRRWWAGDFQPVFVQENDDQLAFVLQAMKPSRGLDGGGSLKP